MTVPPIPLFQHLSLRTLRNLKVWLTISSVVPSGPGIETGKSSTTLDTIYKQENINIKKKKGKEIDLLLDTFYSTISAKKKKKKREKSVAAVKVREIEKWRTNKAGTPMVGVLKLQRWVVWGKKEEVQFGNFASSRFLVFCKILKFGAVDFLTLFWYASEHSSLVNLVVVKFRIQFLENSFFVVFMRASVFIFLSFSGSTPSCFRLDLSRQQQRTLYRSLKAQNRKVHSLDLFRILLLKKEKCI